MKIVSTWFMHSILGVAEDIGIPDSIELYGYESMLPMQSKVTNGSYHATCHWAALSTQISSIALSQPSLEHCLIQPAVASNCWCCWLLSAVCCCRPSWMLNTYICGTSKLSILLLIIAKREEKDWAHTKNCRHNISRKAYSAECIYATNKPNWAS